MSSKRIINKEISQAYIKTALELAFRQHSVIDDDEDVELISFSTIKNPTSIQEWEARKLVPIQIVLRKPIVADTFKVIRHTKD